MLRLKSRDSLLTLQSNADVVEPLEQAVTTERIYAEAHTARGVDPHLLFNQIDSQSKRLAGRNARKQRIDFTFRQFHGQQTTFESIVLENISKARRDDAFDAKLIQSPDSVLATRPTAKVFAP